MLGRPVSSYASLHQSQISVALRVLVISYSDNMTVLFETCTKNVTEINLILVAYSQNAEIIANSTQVSEEAQLNIKAKKTIGHFVSSSS